MKKLLLVLMALTLSSGLFADVAKGQKYYLTYLRPHFEYNGQKFAEQHLKIEWKRLFANNAEKFIEEYSKKHPKATTYLKSSEFQKIAPHVKDFAIKYAADSGELPSCN